MPLGFVHQNTLLFQQGLARSGPTLAEHLKVHALARVGAGGIDFEHSGFLGEAEPEVIPALFARGRERLRRNVNGGEYLARGGGDRGAVPSPEDFQALSLKPEGIPPSEIQLVLTNLDQVPLDSFTNEQALLTEFA